MPGDGVPLGTVFSYSQVEGRVCVKDSLETDVAQDKQHAGAEHRSDEATCVTCETKKGGGGGL